MVSSRCGCQRVCLRHFYLQTVCCTQCIGTVFLQSECENAYRGYTSERNYCHILHIQTVFLPYGWSDVFLAFRFLQMSFCTTRMDKASCRCECVDVCSNYHFERNFCHILYIERVFLPYGCVDVPLEFLSSQTGDCTPCNGMASPRCGCEDVH